ncbi:MAG: hypothetical protein ACLPJH_10740 [Myxococcaceae bacterium]
MTSPPFSTERRRRLQTAPLGLLLLGWGLAVGPLAHAVLAHGEPLLHDSAEWGWVGHTAPEASHQPVQRDTAAPHRHAPGGLEHLQLALVTAFVCLPLSAVVRVLTPTLPAWRAPLLARWWLPEVPGAP